MLSDSTIVVAIDGPAASGKSTVSKAVAKELGFIYVDSGSFYRSITWKALKEGVEASDLPAVLSLLDRIQFDFRNENGAVRFTIDGDDPGMEIREPPVVHHVSDFAAVQEVRDYVVDILRGMVSFERIVMEGRDIGSVVFPETPLKYYLDADPEERARRRYNEKIKNAGTVDKVYKELLTRDQKDSTRKASPLQVSEGSKVIDTTGMGIEEVVEAILDDIRAHEGQS